MQSKSNYLRIYLGSILCIMGNQIVNAQVDKPERKESNSVFEKTINPSVELNTLGYSYLYSNIKYQNKINSERYYLKNKSQAWGLNSSPIKIVIPTNHLVFRVELTPSSKDFSPTLGLGLHFSPIEFGVNLNFNGFYANNLNTKDEHAQVNYTNNSDIGLYLIYTILESPFTFELETCIGINNEDSYVKNIQDTKVTSADVFNLYGSEKIQFYYPLTPSIHYSMGVTAKYTIITDAGSSKNEGKTHEKSAGENFLATINILGLRIKF